MKRRKARGKTSSILLRVGVAMLSFVMLMGSAVSLSADESVAVYCYLGDRSIGHIEVFETQYAARACNAVLYDCKGNCIGCFHDNDYVDDVCVDMYGNTFLR